MYDAIVVGARCAGAATGMLLARNDYRVLLVDRSPFPSETMSTLYIHQGGVALLQKWGLLDAVIRSGAQKLDKVIYGLPGVTVRGPAPVLGEIDGTYAPRRIVLDQIIVNAALAAGAEFRDRCRVIGLLYEGERVSGVRLLTPGGAESAERAHIVIGADGMRSTVADLAGADTLIEDPLMTCVYYGVWQDLPADFEFYERPGNWVAVIPTNDNLTVVSAYFPQRLFPEVRKDAPTYCAEAIRLTSPELHERMRCAQQVEHLRGTGRQRNFFRQAYGKGWVLIGDAGCHKDTITARGITDAFIQAEAVSTTVGPDLRDPCALAASLRRFADQRDQALTGPYRRTLDLARLDISASRMTMLKIISQSARLTDLYLSVVADIKDMEDLLVPELLEHL
jgi:2-polyprenyl-6-methoxyphenol hydroxylase-like FAD-dependent oxidoreductase